MTDTQGPGRELGDLQTVVEGSDEYRKQVAELQAQLRIRDAALADMVKRRQELSLHFPLDEPLRFGLIGDTHFGSTKERLDCLNIYYENAALRGIKHVFHAGDVLTGHHVFRGHEFEVHKHGWEQQKDHFAETAPVVCTPDGDQVETYFITGNHDSSFTKQSGIVVGNALAEARPDWHYVGEDIGRFTLHTADGHEFKILLLHPDGGTPYAISYRIQKVIESLTGGDKPHLLGLGHLHKMNLMPSYRNVIGVDCGCFEDQTNFMARKGAPAHVGGWFFEVHFYGEDELQMQVKPEFLTFY